MKLTLEELIELEETGEAKLGEWLEEIDKMIDDRVKEGKGSGINVLDDIDTIIRKEIMRRRKKRD